MTTPIKLDRARWWILTNSPFYGQLVMGLADQMEKGIPTACTNGKCIKWNPEFLDKLTEPETRFVLLHETLHCAQGHLWRFAPSKKSNVACDHAINLLLQESGLDISMPKGGLADRAYKGLAEEEIFNRLPDDPQGQGSDVCGEFEAPAEGEAEGKKDGNGKGDGNGAGAGDSLRDDWERRVIQAVQAQKASGRGEVPADMERLLDKLSTVKVDWRSEMLEFVKEAISARNDWTRSPSRHAWQDVVYPRRKADTLGLVVFVRDTSGSIDDRLAAEFSGLISQSMQETGCRALVIDCDAQIQDEIFLETWMECPWKAKGGGGTDFRPPFARAKELQEQSERIAGVVYLTDLDGPEPEENDFPTLWICTTDKKAESGRTVNI